jgi:tRNA (guanine-N7-)-methyltransferase
MLKKIRSFVRREGRMTPGQQKALETLLARYELNPEQKALNPDAFGQQTFGREAPRIIEIGFGMGQSLLEMAQHHPERDYLGIEVHRPGVGALLAGIEKNEVTNIRIASTDAVEILERQIPDNSIDAVHLFFPDPWPKKRHNKRRIVQPIFMQRIWEILKPGGQFWMATDCEDYAQYALSVISSMPGFQIASPTQRPLTKFEQRGQRLGHKIQDLLFIKIGVHTS